MKLKIFIATIAVSISLSTVAKININTANVDELALLKGISVSKAQAIVTYRDEHGKFASISDLSKVKGIGAKTVEKLSEDLTVTETTDLSNLTNIKKNKSKLKVTDKKSTSHLDKGKSSKTKKSDEPPSPDKQSQ